MATRFRKSIFATAVALIALASGCRNQPVDPPQAPLVKQWDKTFGGNGYERLQAMSPTSDGGFLLGGVSESPISGDKSQNRIGFSDYWLVKTNSDGTKLWDKIFGGLSKDELRTVVPTSDGGFLLGGSSDSNPPGNKSQESRGGLDYWIVRINADGIKLWDKTFGGNNSDQLKAITPTPDGGFVLGGFSESTASGDKSQNNKGGLDYWVVKISADGTKLWDKTFGGNKQDFFETVLLTPDGGLLLGGFSESPISGDKSQDSKGYLDYWIVKISADGTKLWDKTFGGNSFDYLEAIVPSSDGGYLLGGYTESTISGDKSQDSKGSMDYWIVKISADGAKLWDKTFGGSNIDYLKAIVPTSEGGFLLGGYSTSFSSGDKSQDPLGFYDYWIVKVSADGTKQWDKTFGGKLDEYFEAIAPTSDGGFLLGGYSNSIISGDKSQDVIGDLDYWVVKIK